VQVFEGGVFGGVKSDNYSRIDAHFNNSQCIVSGNGTATPSRAGAGFDFRAGAMGFLVGCVSVGNSSFGVAADNTYLKIAGSYISYNNVNIANTVSSGYGKANITFSANKVVRGNYGIWARWNCNLDFNALNFTCSNVLANLTVADKTTVKVNFTNRFCAGVLYNCILETSTMVAMSTENHFDYSSLYGIYLKKLSLYKYNVAQLAPVGNTTSAYFIEQGSSILNEASVLTDWGIYKTGTAITSTANALPIYSDTTGSKLTPSTVTIASNNQISGVARINAAQYAINGTNGATGTATSANTLTIVSGIITAIA